MYRIYHYNLLILLDKFYARPRVGFCIPAELWYSRIQSSNRHTNELIAPQVCANSLSTGIIELLMHYCNVAVYFETTHTDGKLGFRRLCTSAYVSLSINRDIRSCLLNV
jgi:hypothetical protein